jgi:3-hydroxybutyryl-CoA dehydrogenase
LDGDVDIKKIGVVGAGTMGSGIAQSFAQAGYDVCLVDIADRMLDRARDAIAQSLGKFVERGKLATADRESTLNRIAMATTLEALTTADYIVEAIVENAAAKGSPASTR